MAIELLEKLLTLDPEKRIDAHSALDHQFFWTDPMPCDLTKVISQLQTSNYEYLAKHKYMHQPQSSAVQSSSAAANQSTHTSTTAGYHERVF